MFERLRRRLTLVCALGTGLVLAVMSLFAMRYPIQQLEKQSEEVFNASLNGILLYLQEQSLIEQSWLAQTEAAGGLWVSVESNGKPLLYTSQRPERQELSTLAKQQLGSLVFVGAPGSTGNLQTVTYSFDFSHDGKNYRAALSAIPRGENLMTVLVLKDRSAEDGEIFRIRMIFLGAVTAALALLVLFSWKFTGWAVRPIQENQRRQNQFVSAASHELRSPLAVMQASAEAMQDAPPEKAKRFAATIKGECARLSRLNDDLLTLAGADDRRWSMLCGRVEPETLLIEAGERFESLAAKKKMQVDIRLPDTPLPLLWGDSQRLQQLLDILLNNALSYTPEGGSIRLSAWQEGKSVALAVADSGAGIPPEHRLRVFERFYRVDDSRTDKEHFGLGLAVAMEIATLHKGTLEVEDAAEGGAAFVLRLPIPKPGRENKTGTR